MGIIKEVGEFVGWMVGGVVGHGGVPYDKIKFSKPPDKDNTATSGCNVERIN